MFSHVFFPRHRRREPDNQVTSERRWSIFAEWRAAVYAPFKGAGCAARILGDSYVPALRHGALASLFVVEIVATTIWLDTQTLQTGSRIVRLVAESGPAVLRWTVAAALISLVFRSSTGSELPEPGRMLTSRLSFRWLVAHFGIVTIFAALSVLLFHGQLPDRFQSSLAVAWLVSGVTGAATAALVYLSPRSWVHVLRARRQALAVAVALGAALCLFGWLALVLWQPMSRGTLFVAYAMLHPFVPSASMDPDTFRIGTHEFSVLVSRECSGVEGLGLMLIFSSGWLWLHRAEWRFPRALLLVPIGLVLIWLFNCARIAGLVLVGVAGAPAVAVGGFHSQAGWLGFNVVAIGICLAARNAPWLTAPRRTDAAASSTGPNPAATYLMPLVALLAGAMLSGLGTHTFEWFYPIRVVAVVVVLWHFRHRYRELNWRFSVTAVALGVLVFAIWLALEPLISSAVQQGMPAILADAPQGVRNTWLALRIVGAVITVPIAEELAFRGFLMRRLASDEFEQVSHVGVMSVGILFSSCAFGLLHGERWLAGTLAGFVYAAAYLRRGSIGDAVAAHSTTNALIAVWVLGAGQWQLW